MKYSKLMIVAVLGLVLFQPLAAQQADLLDHPGYVDFSELNEIAGSEPNVEVSLKEPLLRLITNILRNNEEEAAQFISTLIRVNVRVFDSSRIDTDLMSQAMSAVAQRLDTDSWERVVRVREGTDYVDVYFRLSEDAELIQGIAIMVTEPDETVLVNIVGDISPDDISAIGKRFDIDELAEIEVHNGN
ncbi:MAG: DUF4252 domain-containing protein [Gammaproteobacteria bacterium]|nr:DUF4252 domain-containing protein [Gammaproteobacteria bacterium]